MNLSKNIIETTHKVSIASSVKSTSTIFIATSIEIIGIMDMPIAVLKAILSNIKRDNITFSCEIYANKPLMMASVIIAKVGGNMPVNWEKEIFTKLPIAQPSKHHIEFLDACRPVWRHFQLIDRVQTKRDVFLPKTGSSRRNKRHLTKISVAA